MIQYDLIEIMGVLSRACRQDLLARLGQRPKTVTELAGEFNLPHSTVRDNLRRLEQYGLVIAKRDQAPAVYQLSVGVRVQVQPDGGVIEITAVGGTMQLAGLKGPAWAPSQ